MRRNRTSLPANGEEFFMEHESDNEEGENCCFLDSPSSSDSGGSCSSTSSSCCALGHSSSSSSSGSDDDDEDEKHDKHLHDDCVSRPMVDVDLHRSAVDATAPAALAGMEKENAGGHHHHGGLNLDGKRVNGEAGSEEATTTSRQKASHRVSRDCGITSTIQLLLANITVAVASAFSDSGRDKQDERSQDGADVAGSDGMSSEKSSDEKQPLAASMEEVKGATTEGPERCDNEVKQALQLSASSCCLTKPRVFGATLFEDTEPELMPDDVAIALERAILKNWIKPTILGNFFMIKRLEECYKMENVLGSGATAEVVKCIDVRTKKVYALKRINKSKLATKGFNLTLIRMEIMTLLRLRGHRNILQIVALHEDPDFVNIVTEFCDIGDLQMHLEHLSTSKTSKLEQLSDRLRMFYELMEAISFAHQKGVIHRDVKLENIFLKLETDSRGNLEWRVKLADWGLAAHVARRGQPIGPFCCGTFCYMAPEICMPGAYDEKVDIWSASCVLHAILVLSLPFFRSPGDREVNFRSREWNHVPDDLRRLLQQMMTWNPSKRMGAEDVLGNKYLKKVAVGGLVETK